MAHAQVNSMTATTGRQSAASLRAELVDKLCAERIVLSPSVDAAMRHVPREVFVPNAPLPRAYADVVISTKERMDGTMISAASQPRIVAMMLEQLQGRPGEHILEIGTGTGYNAALLAHLVGMAGHITTIDVDADLVEGHVST